MHQGAKLKEPRTRARRREIAQKIAKRIWHKYHDPSIELEKSFHGECLSVFPSIGVYRKTKVFCSNPFCCGNPRRAKGQKNLTRQELIQLEKEKIGIKDEEG